MYHEHLTARNACLLVVIVMLGGSAILGTMQAGQDSWISLLGAMIAAVPLVLVYARLTKLMPDKDLFEMLQTLFGDLLGRILSLLFCCYAAYLGALTLRGAAAFLHITTLPKSPQIAIMLLIILAALYLARSGIETMGKWAAVIFIFSSVVILITLISSIRSLDMTNLLPVMEHGVGEVARGGVSDLAVPFGEAVLVLALVGALRRDDSPYKTFIWGVVIGGALLLLLSLRAILVLGPRILESVYFPDYVATRVIKAWNFLEGLEAFVSAYYILTAVAKIALCLFAAAKGIAGVFKVERHKDILLPISFFVWALGTILFAGMTEMTDFIKDSFRYVWPFQLLIPLLAWITAEIRMRSEKGREGANPAGSP